MASRSVMTGYGPVPALPDFMLKQRTEIRMNKKCIQCRYCRVRLSVWISAAVIIGSIAVMVTAGVPHLV
jgi:hypothetical protein